MRWFRYIYRWFKYRKQLRNLPPAHRKLMFRDEFTRWEQHTTRAVNQACRARDRWTLESATYLRFGLGATPESRPFIGGENSSGVEVPVAAWVQKADGTWLLGPFWGVQQRKLDN